MLSSSFHDGSVSGDVRGQVQSSRTFSLISFFAARTAASVDFTVGGFLVGLMLVSAILFKCVLVSRQPFRLAVSDGMSSVVGHVADRGSRGSEEGFCMGKVGSLPDAWPQEICMWKW